MLSKPKLLPGCVVFLRMRWLTRRTSNSRTCKPIIICSLNRRRIERRLGLTVRKTWTKRKSPEQIWAISWRRTPWPLPHSSPSTDTCHTTLRASSQTQLMRSKLLRLSKLRITRTFLSLRRLRSILGQCRIWRTPSTSSTMRLILRTSTRRWSRSIVRLLRLRGLPRRLDGPICMVTWTHSPMSRRTWSQAQTSGQSSEIQTNRGQM